MITIRTSEDLIRKVTEDVEKSGCQKATIIAGHFPYVVTSNLEVITTEYWKHFTKDSFELGCQLQKDFTEEGIDSKIAIIVDDINYIEPSAPSKFRKSLRQQIYRDASKKSPEIPDVFSKILDKYGLDTSILLTQNQGKENRNNSHLLSERYLLSQTKETQGTECARSFRAFIEKYKTPEIFLFSMIPSPCFKSICSATTKDEDPTIKNAYFLFDRDFEKEMTTQEMFDKELVEYQ